MTDRETCPHCNGSLVDDRPGPTGQRGWRTIGIEVLGVYDGILYWMCPDCSGTWHRWPEGHHLRIRAQGYVAS
jgi:hypothetical protein